MPKSRRQRTDDEPAPHGASDRVLDPHEEIELLNAAEGDLDRARTKQDVVNVWKAYYLKLGHRKLGRLLLGYRKSTK